MRSFDLDTHIGNAGAVEREDPGGDLSRWSWVLLKKKKKKRKSREEKEKDGKKTVRAAGETCCDWPAAMELLFCSSSLQFIDFTLALSLSLTVLPKTLSPPSLGFALRLSSLEPLLSHLVFCLYFLTSYATPPKYPSRHLEPHHSRLHSTASLFPLVKYRTPPPSYLTD